MIFIIYELKNAPLIEDDDYSFKLKIKKPKRKKINNNNKYENNELV
jgi:hypothetical protein